MIISAGFIFGGLRCEFLFDDEYNAVDSTDSYRCTCPEGCRRVGGAGLPAVPVEFYATDIVGRYVVSYQGLATYHGIDVRSRFAVVTRLDDFFKTRHYEDKCGNSSDKHRNDLRNDVATGYGAYYRTECADGHA